MQKRPQLPPPQDTITIRARVLPNTRRHIVIVFGPIIAMFSAAVYCNVTGWITPHIPTPAPYRQQANSVIASVGSNPTASPTPAPTVTPAPTNTPLPTLDVPLILTEQALDHAEALKALELEEQRNIIAVSVKSQSELAAADAAGRAQMWAGVAEGVKQFAFWAGMGAAIVLTVTVGVAGASIVGASVKPLNVISDWAAALLGIRAVAAQQRLHQMRSTMPPPPALPAPTTPRPAPAPNTAPTPAPARVIPVNHAGHPGQMALPTPNDWLAAEKFIEQCIDTVGADATVIPGFRQLENMTPRNWMTATENLRALLGEDTFTKAGAGPAAQWGIVGATLGDLLDKIESELE